MKQVQYPHDLFEIRFRAAGQEWKDVLLTVKSLQGRLFEPATGMWTCPPTRNNAAILSAAGFEFDAQSAIFLQPRKCRQEIIHKPVSERTLTIPAGLYPYQSEGVEWLESRNGNGLIGDEMGLGKTIQALAWAAARPDLWPVLIVCPASLKPNWAAETMKWAKVRHVDTLYGMKPMDLPRSPFIVINYDILGFEDPEEKAQEALRKERCKREGRPYRQVLPRVLGWVEFLMQLPIKMIIADEVQYISESHAIRTRAFKQLCRNHPQAKRVFLSGTPYQTHAKQFFNCLNLLSSKLFPKEWDFRMRYCNAKKGHFGWTFDGLTNGQELHELISQVMIRRLKKDVLPDLPPKRKCIVPMELDPVALKAYRKSDDAFFAGMESGKMSEVEKQATLDQLKVSAYNAKRDAMVQWIKEYLYESEGKLVCFTYHVAVMKDMMDEFGFCAVFIDGSTPVPKRGEIVKDFQTNPKIQLFFGQIIAAGVGLTLTAAAATAFLELGDTPAAHAQAEDRIHRIGQEADSVTAYYLMAEGTVEQDIIARLSTYNEKQRTVLDGIEGDSFFQGTDTDFRKGILETYMKRRRYT